MKEQLLLFMVEKSLTEGDLRLFSSFYLQVTPFALKEYEDLDTFLTYLEQEAQIQSDFLFVWGIAIDYSEYKRD